jgi:hypothetical protein
VTWCESRDFCGSWFVSFPIGFCFRSDILPGKQSERLFPRVEEYQIHRAKSQWRQNDFSAADVLVKAGLTASGEWQPPTQGGPFCSKGRYWADFRPFFACWSGHKPNINRLQWSLQPEESVGLLATLVICKPINGTPLETIVHLPDFNW